MSNTQRPGNPEFEKVLDILQTKVIRIYDKLWDIRTPFLVSESACLTPNSILSSFHECLNTLSVATSSVLEAANRCVCLPPVWRRSYEHFGIHRKVVITEKNSRMPHVLFLIWIHNPNQELRSQALTRFSVVIDSGSWPTFFRSVSHGCTSRDHIKRATLRDLRDENIVNVSLFAVASVLILCPITNSNAFVLVSSELQPALLGLAAGRRQLCLGNNTGMSHSDIIMTIFGAVMSVTFARRFTS